MAKDHAFPIRIPVHDVSKVDPLNPPPENSIGLTKEEFDMLTAYDPNATISVGYPADGVDWAKKTPAEIEADILAAQGNDKRHKMLISISTPNPMSFDDVFMKMATVLSDEEMAGFRFEWVPVADPTSRHTPPPEDKPGAVNGRQVTVEQLRFFTDPDTTMLVADGRRLRIMYEMLYWNTVGDPLAVAIFSEYTMLESQHASMQPEPETLDEMRASLDRLKAMCDRHGWHEHKRTLRSP